MPAAIEPAAATAINQERENFLELIEAIARHIAATRAPLQHYAALERAIARVVGCCQLPKFDRSLELSPAAIGSSAAASYLSAAGKSVLRQRGELPKL